MAKSITQPSSVGQANIVLVFGQDDKAPSVISKIIATARIKAMGPRIRLHGTSMFEQETITHINDTVLRVVDGIVQRLGLSTRCFDLSIVDLEVTSVLGISLAVSGFSADLPIFLALLSAALQIPIPNSIVSTGHIASPNGDIRMVKAIPAKLDSAIKADNIHSFILPSIDQDNSLGSLSPHEKEIISNAIVKAKAEIEILTVNDISDLVKAVFLEDMVVHSSLKNSFCDEIIDRDIGDNPIDKSARFFGEGIYQRFWKILERKILSGNGGTAKELLSALISYHTQQKTYPKNIGEKLLKIVSSVAPATLRQKIDFPLIQISQFMELGQSAGESDYEDLKLLFSATYREKLNPQGIERKEHISKVTEEDYSEIQIQSILSEIDQDALASRFGIPIDSARASYVMDSVSVSEFDDFNKVVTSFYIHLVHYTKKTSEPVLLQNAEAEAFSLIENAFSKKGGFKGALSEAKYATHGGLRMILDMMTEQFKLEEQTKHINYVLKSVLDPLDWESKVSLIRAMLKNLQHVLPEKTRSQPPERFAGQYELIVNAYVQSINNVNSVFRRL